MSLRFTEETMQMSDKSKHYAAQARARHRAAILGVLVLVMGFGAAGMAGACVSSAPGTSASTSSGDPFNPAAACPANNEVPCMRYHIPLAGNPSTDVALRSKYIAAFGSACYMSEFGTFDCFYQKWEKACADAVKIGEVSGNAPYDKGYMCQPVAGTEDYTLQIGSDVANYITINYQAAPRQTPLTEINRVPTEVSGPYRNLTDPAGVGPGDEFEGNSGVSNGDGGLLLQREWVVQVNKNANDGGVRSDLAGFTWKCKGEDGGDTMCIEPDFLPDPEDPGATQPNVHHVVPKKDLRCCPWGTNSYKNAAVISRKLNELFSNNDPPPDEVKQLNSAKGYTP
ncbi:MAG: hypothetical protein QM820_23490 [Minicystis sp.]